MMSGSGYASQKKKKAPICSLSLGRSGSAPLGGSRVEDVGGGVAMQSFKQNNLCTIQVSLFIWFSGLFLVFVPCFDGSECTKEFKCIGKKISCFWVYFVYISVNKTDNQRGFMGPWWGTVLFEYHRSARNIGWQKKKKLTAFYYPIRSSFFLYDKCCGICPMFSGLWCTWVCLVFVFFTFFSLRRCCSSCFLVM